MKSSCIVTPAKDSFVIVRQSWVEICEGNHCAAMLLNFFVSWHDWKLEHQPHAIRENAIADRHGYKPEQNTTLLQHHTLSELKNGLVGFFAERTISKGIAKLVELGFLEQRRNPNPRYKFDQTHYYLVFPEAIQSAIDSLGRFARSILPKDPVDPPKDLYDSAITSRHTAKVHDEDANLRNHYQDTIQSTFQNTKTNPERVYARSKDVEKSAYAERDSFFSETSHLENLSTSGDRQNAYEFASESKPCGLNKLEALSNSSNDDSYTRGEEEGFQEILANVREMKEASLEVTPDIQKKEISPPPRVTSDDNKVTIFGKPTIGANQKARAKANSLLEQGVKNKRWKDFADYEKFRKYAIEWARQRREGVTPGTEGQKYDERWIETVVSRTATCTIEDSPILTCWKAWCVEIPTPPLISSMPAVEIAAPWSEETKRKADAWLAEHRARKAAIKAEELAQQKRTFELLNRFPIANV